MQAALAEEHIDGAAAYGLTDADRPRVAAFMAGLNRTAGLKFDHPGLGTTATRSGDRLVIQNDIGTTDAHVIVVHVEERTVTVTYTDIHPERLRFFQDLLARYAPDWESTRTGQLSGADFQLATGRYTARGRGRLPRLPGLPRLPPGVPDRLEPRPQAVARLPARQRPHRPAALGGGAGGRAPRLPGTRRCPAGEPGDRGGRRLRHAFRRPPVRRARPGGDAGLPALRAARRHRLPAAAPLARRCCTTASAPNSPATSATRNAACCASPPTTRR